MLEDPAPGARTGAPARTAEITHLLEAWQAGDPNAGDELFPLIYRELRQIAGGYLAVERSGHTLQPTALVHEAYLRLVRQRRLRWQNRSHFFAIAAKIIRQVLVDHARRYRAAKRGGNLAPLPLSEAGEVAVAETPDLVRLEEALSALEEVAPRQARVVEYRFYGGLTTSETGALLGCSESTVKRQWLLARCWLYRYLAEGESRYLAEGESRFLAEGEGRSLVDA